MLEHNYAIRSKRDGRRRTFESDELFLEKSSKKEHRKNNSFNLPNIQNLNLIDISSSIDTNKKAILPIKKTNCFLSHNWGENKINHMKVSIINKALEKRGLSTWFDENEMEGNIRYKMAEGIDNTNCVIVFITKQYRDKVNGIDMKDNCKYEFTYGVNQLGSQNMIPVVMEADMRNTYEWKGELGAALGSMLYIDFTEDQINSTDKLEKKYDDLYNMIINIIEKYY